MHDSIQTTGVPGETYRVGGDSEQKNMTFNGILCDLVDQHLGQDQGSSRKLKTFVQDRAGHDRRYAIDAAKIQGVLRWKPSVNFEEGLRKTVECYLHCRVGYLIV